MTADEQNPYQAPTPDEEDAKQRQGLRAGTIIGGIVTNLAIVFGIIVPALQQAGQGNWTPIFVAMASVTIIALAVVFFPFERKPDDAATTGTSIHRKESSPP